MWDTDAAKRLGAAISEMRKAKGLSQEALAYQAGITKNQMQLIESGRASGRKDETGPSNPRMATLGGIAEVLGVPISHLLVEAGI